MKKDILDKEIVDTFFSSVPKRKEKQRERLFIYITLIVTGAFLLLLAYFSIIVIIKVKEKSKKILSDTQKFILPILENGVINRQLIEKVYFDGDAEGESVFLDNCIKLVNKGRYGRASLNIEFREPINMKGRSLLLFGKTEQGSKRLHIIFKDYKDSLYQYSDIAFSPVWNMKHVYIRDTDKFGFQKSMVKGLKLEFGSLTTGNTKESVIYLRDLVLRDYVLPEEVK